MENITNQLALTLVLLKEHIIESLKRELQSVAKEVISSLTPQLQSIAKEVASMKNTIQKLEETMKKSLVPSSPRSGDVVSNDLDDFYISGDALQQQLYQQSQTSTTIAPESSDRMNNSRFLSQQQCLQTPNPGPNAFKNAAKYPGNFCDRRTYQRANQQVSVPCIQPAVFEEFYSGMTPVLNSQPAKKEVLPNRTVTSSDPLPSPNNVTWKLPQLPTLSVTIPPHQIKADLLGNQHLERGGGISNTFYNIPTSVSTTNTSNAAVSVAPTEACNKHATFRVKPEVEAPAAAAGFESSNDSTAESFGSGVNIFGMDCDQHGEDEELVFCQRAELFRQIDKEWKERGIGDIKILKNTEGTHRIFVKLDQIHEICANYKISPEMTLTIPKNETKGFIWAFNDFSKAELRVEKFFIRFKLPETAVAFQEAFSRGWETAKSGKTLKIEENPLSPEKSTIRNFATITLTNKNENTADRSSSLPGIPNVMRSTAADSFKFTTFSLPANFKFGNSLAANTGVSIGCGSCTTSTTTLINCTSNVTGTISSLTSVSSVTNANTSMNTISSCKDIRAALASIFNNLNKSTTSPFSIAAAITTTSVAPVMVSKENVSSNVNKSAASDAEDDYVSNAEFQPVTPLPDVVEVNTGEENEIVLFEHRAKLLRFDKTAGEWKERGLGNIKLLRDKDDVNKLRLLMRREQVHKLCCNQRVYKDTVFTYMKNSDTALSWAGQDFSDNELVVEMLTVRFKTPEVCKQFLKALNEAQDRMSAEGKETNVQSSKACSEAAAQDAEMGSKGDEKKQGFGDIFKSQAGSWTCETCYILNEADKIYCVACDSPKDNTVPPKSTVSNIAAPINKTFNFGFPAAGAASTILTPSLPTQSTFTFQKPDANTKRAFAFSDKQPTADLSQTSLTSIGGFGDPFKPKAGSWVCPSCYVSNTGDSVHCMTCEAPKNSTIPKKEANTHVLCLSDPAQKFSFGFPAANTSKSEIITPKVDFSFNAGSIPATSVFTFTTSSTTSTSLSTIPITTLVPNPATLILESDKLSFVDGLPLQNTEALSKINTGQDFASDAFSLNREVFTVTLKAKTPGKSGKSPSKFGSDDDGAGDEDTESECPDEKENSAHFTPFIPLPEENKEIADKFMKAVKKASDGTASPMVETLDATTSVSTSASLGPCASNISEETEKLANDFQLRLNCVEQPNSYSTASQGCDPEKFTYIDARNHGTNLSHENPKNSSASNIFGDLIEMKNMGDVTNLTSTTADKTQSTCIFVFDDTIKSAFGSAINYPKDSNLKNFTFDSSSSVAYFPSNKITTAGGYVTSRAADRKDFSFGQKPLIFGNSSSVLGEITAGKAQPTSNIFESKINSLSKGSIFGQIPPKFGNSSSVFANSSPKFGNSSFVFTNSSSIFDNSSSVFANSSPMFGNSSSVFANSSSTLGNSSSVFANSSSTFGKPSPSIFDSAIKGGSVNSSIYGSSFISFTGLPSNENTTADTYVFGSGEIPTTTSTHVAASLFECSAVTTNTGSANTGPFMDLSKTATAAIDFASLAAKVPKDDKVMVAFAKGNEKPGPGNFIGLTDQNAFARFAKPLMRNDAKNNQTDDCSAAEKTVNDKNFGPHYEPVIALAEKILITTGEDEETKLFGEPATLFRWDDRNKEWKERGVGELKILFHPTKQTYRMLMRREKVYKLILNHAVNAYFSFSEIKKSPKSFLWATMNYAECPEGVLEKLAVRFENAILADLFREHLNKCIAANQNRDY
uniref:E3 SUMO-protein ligase RanBP2 n=1 Tax=Glossina morsitans morsitans TaxID=37546 RepID=A0A1B0FKA0_GLOMM